MEIMLENILSADRCQIDNDSKSLKATLEKLANLIANGLTNINHRDVFQELIDREKLGGTGLGHGVALPHARSISVKTPTAAFIKLKHPVDFKAEDNEKVDLIFCLFVPEDVEQTHLAILAKLASIFNKEDNRKELREICVAEELRSKLIALSQLAE